MKTIHLTVSSPETGAVLAELEWRESWFGRRGGTLSIHHASSGIAEALGGWAADGLIEWVGSCEPVQRITRVDEDVFLERVADYLRRQFDFTTELREREERPDAETHR